MAAPTPSWNTVRVYGTWRNLDGSLKAGTYTVRFPVRITNATDDAIIPAGTLKNGSLPNDGQLQTTDNNEPSIDFACPASDDPDNSPNGWQVTIEVKFTDGSTGEKFVIDVPLAAEEINLRTVVTPQEIPPTQVLTLRGVAGGLAELDSEGDVIDAEGGKVVRFRDLDGEPIGSGVVTIKVDTDTGEVEDIVFEGN